MMNDDDDDDDDDDEEGEGEGDSGVVDEPTYGHLGADASPPAEDAVPVMIKIWMVSHASHLRLEISILVSKLTESLC